MGAGREWGGGGGIRLEVLTALASTLTHTAPMTAAAAATTAASRLFWEASQASGQARPCLRMRKPAALVRLCRLAMRRRAPIPRPERETEREGDRERGEEEERKTDGHPMVSVNQILLVSRVVSS